MFETVFARSGEMFETVFARSDEMLGILCAFRHEVQAVLLKVSVALKSLGSLNAKAGERPILDALPLLRGGNAGLVSDDYFACCSV